ncbi:MAG: hypothetical protein EZS28_044814, partial [Streblomastix strix]
MFYEGYSQALLNERCVRNRLGSEIGENSEPIRANLCIGDIRWNSQSQILQLKRTECCSDESKTLHQDYSQGNISLNSNRLHNNRVLSEEMENIRDDVVIIDESEKTSYIIWNQNLNITYSGNIESNNRWLEQDGNQQKLLTGSTSTVVSVPKASDLPSNRWLRESNQQIRKKILQLVTGQLRRRTGCVQSELEQRVLLAAPSDYNDI